MYSQRIFTLAKENTKYAYAVGRIRALETRLLDRAAIGRLLEAESAQEVLKLLSEGEYESSLSNIREPADFETALNVERERIYTLIDELSLDPELTQMFRVRWDFHNLKVLLKSSYLGVSGVREGGKSPQPPLIKGEVSGDRIKGGTSGGDARGGMSDGDAKGGTNGDGVLVNSGVVPIEELRSVIEPEAGSQARMPAPLAPSIESAVEDARAQYEESQNPQMIDIVMDNHLQSFLYQRAADYPNPFLCGYFAANADLTNIKSFIRIKMLGENVRVLDAALLPHGSLSKEMYMRQFDETVENFASTLTNTPYAELAAEGIRRWAEEHSLAAFERLSDDYLVSYIKPAKYIVFGVEPLIGYVLAKEHEMKLIRIIVIGKLNDLPTEAIRERLRDTYVN